MRKHKKVRRILINKTKLNKYKKMLWILIKIIIIIIKGSSFNLGMNKSQINNKKNNNINSNQMKSLNQIPWKQNNRIRKPIKYFSHQELKYIRILVQFFDIF